MTVAYPYYGDDELDKVVSPPSENDGDVRWIETPIAVELCDHALAGLLPEPDGTLAITEFDYCPKCGEKL